MHNLGIQREEKLPKTVRSRRRASARFQGSEKHRLASRRRPFSTNLQGLLEMSRAFEMVGRGVRVCPWMEGVRGAESESGSYRSRSPKYGEYRYGFGCGDE